MKNLLFIYLIAGVLFSSCSDDCKECVDPNGQRIVLSSEVTLNNIPRVVEQIRAGQSLSLFVTPTGVPAELLYSNVMLNASGTGGFTYSQNMYYPLDGRNVDFFAIHPYVQGAALGGTVNFSVSSDQSAEKNYLNSDLLHALNTNVQRTSQAVQMVFSHKLCKVDVVLQTINNEIEINNLNSVEMLNVLPSTTVSPLTGTITAATGNATDISAFGVRGSAFERDQVSGISAIVVPQTFTPGSQLFRIMIGQQAYVYTIPAIDPAIVLEEGNRYTMTLTLSSSGIELSSSVNPWLDGGSIGNGTAEPQR